METGPIAVLAGKPDVQFAGDRSGDHGVADASPFSLADFSP
jgi:hypothetical protein